MASQQNLNQVALVPLDVVASDYDGELYKLGGEGEFEVKMASRIHYISRSMFTVLSQGLTDDMYARFIEVNVSKLIEADQKITFDDAFKICYIRSLAIKAKLITYSETHVADKVKYLEYKILDDVEFGAVYIDDVLTEKGIWDTQADWRIQVQKKFYDMVALVAYMFRVRGHHYVDSMREKYVAIWQKCMYEEDNVGLEWKYVAHEALHAIVPRKLDEFYVHETNLNHLSGALAKRVHAFPAGVAAMAALQSGVGDLLAIVPQAKNMALDAYKHYEEIMAKLKTHRWAGSVNRNFYGGPAVSINEAMLGPLAALISSLYAGVASHAPILGSQSLQRISNTSPLAGGLGGKMLLNALKDPEISKRFIIYGKLNLGNQQSGQAQP